EMIRSFLLEKRYEAMDVKSREYNPVIIDLVYVIPSFFGELPTETLKDAITAIAKKYKEADSWYFGNAVLIPLRGACNKVLLKSTGVDDWGDEQWVLTDEVLAPEKLDFLCWIALQIIGNAKDSDDRDSGERILNFISQKGYAKAKDYLKFGSGNIGKEYTHLKNKKFEAIANDIRRTVEFKVKEEDAESYGGMLDFIITLLKQGFPADYQIKINSKLKNHIPVSNLKRSKTNLFFGNAATFPELWGRMAEYVREIFDEFTYYSDAEDDEAATVGSYAVYALGAADLKANREIVDWFLSKVDTEHDLNTRNFAKEYME
uniref:DUF6138 family protein n=1 Tax=Dysgonomonas gadei TaxID=156974 RepID=UPI003AF10289